MEQQQSRLWIALRARDPVIRKRLVDNVMKLPEFEGRSNWEDDPLQWMFEWRKSPEGQGYWEELAGGEYYGSEYWADEPILDDYKLPDEYQVQCPRSIPEEWSRICRLASGDSGGGEEEVYYLFHGPDDGYDMDDRKYPDIPEIDYQVWKLAVENQYGEKKTKILSFRTTDGYDIPADNKKEDFFWYFGDGKIEENFCSVVEAHKSSIQRGDSQVFKFKKNAEDYIKIHWKSITVEESFLKKDEPWSIVTTDGVTLREGDSVVWVFFSKERDEWYVDRSCTNPLHRDHQRLIDEGKTKIFYR